MYVYFWGTRASLPAFMSADIINKKVIQAIEMANNHIFADRKEIERFVGQELPFTVRGGYGNNTPCVEIGGGDEFIICDAGTGLRELGNIHSRLVAEGVRKPNAVFNIFISHLHWGHIQGFPFFTPALEAGNRIRVFGFHKDIEEAFIHQQNSPYFPVPLKNMKADLQFVILTERKKYEIGGFKIEGIKQPHPGDSYGYRFEKNGNAIVYSTDAEHKTSWDQSVLSDDYPFIGFFRDADLLIFDAQYEWLEAVQEKDNWGHSSYVAAVELSVKAGVKHLCLFHSDPTYDDDRLDVLLEDTRNYLKTYNDGMTHPLKIDLAYDGMRMTIMSPKSKALLEKIRVIRNLKTKLKEYEKLQEEWETIPNNKQKRPEMTLSLGESALYEELIARNTHERLSQNDEPLNQKAKRFLLQEKEQPDPSYLYCLQLAIWGAENGLTVDYEAQEILYQMLAWDPKKVMRALTQANPKDPEEVFDLLKGHKEPKDLAWSILDRIQDMIVSDLEVTKNPMETHYQWILKKVREYIQMESEKKLLEQMSRVAPDVPIQKGDTPMVMAVRIEEAIPLQEKRNFPRMSKMAKEDYDLITYLEETLPQE
jgi:phosphoribosyl 1,2-cyclic phosphodiesterase